MRGIEALSFGGRTRILEWVRDPSESLKTVNAAGGNDRQIKAMIDRFGFPQL